MRLIQFLLEYDRAITVQRLGEKIVQRAGRDRHFRHEKDPDAIVAQLEPVDPTVNKQYTEWVVRQFIKGVSYEDLSTTVKHNLATFDQLKLRKKLAPEHRDINKLSAAELAIIIRTHEEQFAGGAKDVSEEQKGKYKVIHSGPKTMVIQILDEKAAIYFGANTSWCTKNGAYNNYAPNGDIYNVVPKYPSHRYERYQLHFASKQCKDEDDQSFKFSKLIMMFPELRPVFAAIPEFSDLEILSADEMTSKQKEQARKQKEKEREDAVNSILASLWK